MLYFLVTLLCDLGKALSTVSTLVNPTAPATPGAPLDPVIYEQSAAATDAKEWKQKKKTRTHTHRHKKGSNTR